MDPDASINKQKGKKKSWFSKATEEKSRIRIRICNPVNIDTDPRVWIRIKTSRILNTDGGSRKIRNPDLPHKKNGHKKVVLNWWQFN